MRRPALLLPSLAAVLLAVALLLPPLAVPRRTVDAIVVLDITQSMDVEDRSLDGVPVSRLAFAQAAARRALRELPCGSRIGWGAFTEYRTLLLMAPIEVCGNYADLLATLAQVDGRVRWGDASEVSKGVFWALRAARDVGGDPAVVFVTDGQESPPIDGARFAMFEDLKAGQVRGWLVGVGGPVPRPIPRSDAQGVRVGYWRAEDVIQRNARAGEPRSHEELSSLHETHLRDLAAKTGLAYATLDEVSGLEALLRDTRLARWGRVPTELGWLPAALAGLLLVVHFRPDALRRRRRAGPPLSPPVR